MKRGILATRDELRELRQRIDSRPFDAIYARLEKRCALILEAAPMTEGKWRSMWQHGSWGSALLAARTTQGRFMDLLIADHVEPNRAYRDRAQEEFENLISWTSWTDPCHKDLAADLCTAEAAVAAVIALDWMWEDLPKPLRDSAIEAIRVKALRPYLQAVKDEAWWYTCYHNWNGVINGGIALAALALNGDDIEAKKAHQLARKGLTHFFDAMGRQGGWDEGIGYWGYAIRYVALLAEAEKRLLQDRSLYHSRGMDRTGLFPVYFTPNGHAASFGESPHEPFFGALYLLAREYGVRELAWWLDTYAFHRDLSTSGWSAAGLALLFRPQDIPMVYEPKLDAAKVYDEIGWAALADQWPRPKLYVAAKSGDLSANHSQHDMNAIQIQVSGEMLLMDLDPGEYRTDYYSDGRQEVYEAQASAHNTIVVGERDHMIDSRGIIRASGSDEKCRWVLCDAADACGESVRFLRHVVMLVDPASQVGQAVVVVDELTNGMLEKVEQFWHTHGTVEVDREKQVGRIAGKRSELHFAFASTIDLPLSSLSRKINPHRSENILLRSGGLRGRGLLVSVFATSRIGRIELPASMVEPVDIRVGKATLKFDMPNHHLQLSRVVID